MCICVYVYIFVCVCVTLRMSMFFLYLLSAVPPPLIKGSAVYCRVAGARAEGGGFP